MKGPYNIIYDDVISVVNDSTRPPEFNITFFGTYFVETACERSQIIFGWDILLTISEVYWVLDVKLFLNAHSVHWFLFLMQCNRLLGYTPILVKNN